MTNPLKPEIRHIPRFTFCIYCGAKVFGDRRLREYCDEHWLLHLKAERIKKQRKPTRITN